MKVYSVTKAISLKYNGANSLDYIIKDISEMPLLSPITCHFNFVLRIKLEKGK